MSVDRRKRKTRDALRNALSDLIEEKSYNEITVQELAEHANVSRSSFYLHFRDKDDLLLSGFEEIGIKSPDDIFLMSANDPGYPDFSIMLFRGSEGWQGMARACLCGPPGNAAAGHMRNLLVVRSREWLKSTHPNLSSLELEATVHYLANALLGLLTWWVQSDFPCSAEAASLHCNRLLKSGLQGVLQLEDAQA